MTRRALVVLGAVLLLLPRVSGAQGDGALPPSVPPLTDEDRRAAFPDVTMHDMSGRNWHSLVVADHLEWQRLDGASLASWDARGWVGGDRTRLWFRANGEAGDGHLRDAGGQALMGRMVSRWWDVVGGVRQDVRPGDPQTWAAIGIQGLAPYWFDVEATAYVGASGRTQFRAVADYDLLVTNRLILQPAVTVEANGKADAARATGAGLSRTEMGLRWRYEVRREFAPYLGVVWSRQWFGSADLARQAGERVGGARLVAGVRVWH